MTHDEHNRIAAWLDGELPEAERLVFEQAMADDPALAETVARWQANDAALRAAFDQSHNQPVDDAFLARLGLAPAQTDVERVDGSNIVSLAAEREARQAANSARTPPRPVALRPLWRWVGGGALAASLALVATLSLRPGPDAAGGVAADAAFQTALDRTPSGTQVALLPQQGALTPILSFAAASGQWCREYRVDGPAARSGVACREAGGWRVEGEVRGASAPANSGRIVTAGGADGGSLDAIYRRLDASDPIDTNRENQVIANGWAATPPAPPASQSARPAQ